MFEPELPDFIDAKGVRYSAELICRRVVYRGHSDTAIGIFHQPYPNPEGSVWKELNVRYLGYVNSRVERAKWDIRKLSAHDCKTY